MPVFPLLAEPDRYRACDWDFLRDAEGRAYYLRLFSEMFPSVAAAAIESGYDPAALEFARVVLFGWLKRLEAAPRLLGERLDILALDRLHSSILSDHGVLDPYAALKSRETRSALALLPDRLRDLDATSAERRPSEIVRGVFAGNVFDMGAKQTAARFGAGRSPTFDAFLREVRPRPWLFDDLSNVRFTGHCRCVVFVDNAGGDITLGMLPLIRELLRCGAKVVAAANTRPAWNDITIGELQGLTAEVPDLAGAVRDGSLVLVGSGTGEPLIDLSDVSQELCDAAAGADLLVLEGMGRALESNWDAAFTCETWRLATIKDPMIAKRKGGGMYDCVCMVRPPRSS